MTDTIYDKVGLYAGVTVPDPPCEAQVQRTVNAYADQYRMPLNSNWLSRDLSEYGDRRWYHNVNHAMAVTNMLAACNYPVSPSLSLAFMFGFNHDRIYTGKTDGSAEVCSAEMMLTDYIICKLHDKRELQVTTLAKAYAAILATAQHTVDQTCLPFEVKVCLDADLYSLATDDYARNAVAIYLESKAFGVSDKDYIVGRAAWLDKMLKRKSVFLTHALGDPDKLNASALHNMRHEFNKLQPLVLGAAVEDFVNGG